MAPTYGVIAENGTEAVAVTVEPKPADSEHWLVASEYTITTSPAAIVTNPPSDSLEAAAAPSTLPSEALSAASLAALETLMFA
jgi:hypothetical protein